MLILKKSPMELKSIIGLRTTEDGNKVRMNNIALQQLKYFLSSKDERIANVRKEIVSAYFGGANYTNDELLRQAISAMMHKDFGSIDLEGIGIRFPLAGYRTDYLNGLCMDGDTNCIRLVKDDDKVIKKKVGKVVREYLEQKKALCDVAKTYICEYVSQQWKAYAAEHQVQGKYILVVDDDFDAIYSSDKRVGDFHSCMTNMDCVEFYEKVNAKAASLRDSDDRIVARCVVFNEVYDLEGNMYRYAERQYSTDQDLTLQQLLVNMLYKEGYIDINKQVGASCSDSNNVVDKNGNSMRGTVLYIEHRFESGDMCPYMDGFAYYNDADERMYNDSDYGEVTLHETDGYYPGGHVCELCGRHIDEDDRCWSEYYDMELCEDCAIWSERIEDYIREDCAVEVYHADGSGDNEWMPEDWNDYHSHDNFTEVNGVYYWDDELVWIDDEAYLPEDTCYDDLNDRDIPREDAVEYKQKIGGSWYYYMTHEDEVGETIVDVDGEYCLIDDCVWDNINEEWILKEDSVEYKTAAANGWAAYKTRESEIDETIVEFEGEYYLIDDCECVDDEWYPYDQVPEKDDEEVEEEETIEC